MKRWFIKRLLEGNVISVIHFKTYRVIVSEYVFSMLDYIW